VVLNDAARGKDIRTSVSAGLDAAVLVFAFAALDAVDYQTGQVAVELFFQRGGLGCVEVSL